MYTVNSKAALSENVNKKTIGPRPTAAVVRSPTGNR